MPTQVIFVHGLWMHSSEGSLLRLHLGRSLGAETPTFNYRSVTERLESAADRLARQMRQLGAREAGAGGSPAIHLVGHSLGGLLVLRMFERHADLPAGRIVLLGSPVTGSHAAQRLSIWPATARLLGHSHPELVNVSPACATREIGVIAGNRPIGLGRLLTRFDEPNDGTVAVRETELECATDRIVLPVGHTGMLISPQVARETAHFLRHGRFSLRASS